jgi:hypothetical protein
MEYSPILQFQGSSIKLALAGSQEAESKVGLGIEFVKKKFAEKLSQSQDFLTMFPANSINEKQIVSGIYKKLLSTNSLSYFTFFLKIANKNFDIKTSDFTNEEQIMLLMIHYDIWQNAGGFISLEESIKEIGKNKILVKEIIEVLEYLIEKIDFKEIDIDLPYSQPLKLHSRYTRDQILVAFGFSTFSIKSSNREGIAENKQQNTEILFIDLVKSEADFSPSTMYNDYAINELLFHWQSQNSSKPELGRGLSYIQQIENNKQNAYQYNSQVSFINEDLMLMIIDLISISKTKYTDKYKKEK